jgi:N-acetylmuramic acid 6-phosphate etherase
MRGLPVQTTETVAAAHADLDTLAPADMARRFILEQRGAVEAALAVSADIAAAAAAAAPRLRAGGRLLYFGAGTSGRLALLDAVELVPTFSWPAERAVATLAGGAGAVHQAVEGAEDDAAQGERDLLALQPTADDVVIAVAASGRTPYAMAVLRAARPLGALTIAFANNPGTPMLALAEHGILLATGAEVIAGSTRLKAGTAQKIALNTLSSCLMVQLEKVHGNLMVDLRATNAKLVARATALVQRLTRVDELSAARMLEACGLEVKTAVVALQCDLAPAAARARLAERAGSLRRAIEEPL